MIFLKRSSSFRVLNKLRKYKIKKAFKLVGLRKSVLTRIRFMRFIGMLRTLRRKFFLLKKKQMFFFRIKKKVLSLVKKNLKHCSAFGFFNIILNVQSKLDYLQLKSFLEFSYKTCFEFQFLYLKKKWVKQFFLKNDNWSFISKIIQGSVLFLQTLNLFSTLKVIEFFLQNSVFCLGIMFYNRLLSFDYLIRIFCDFKESIKVFFVKRSLFLKFFFNFLNNFFFRFFKLLNIKKNANFCSACI